LLLALSWIGLIIATLQPPPEAETVAAVFPPWWGPQRAFLAAASTGAEIIRTGAVPTILVLHMTSRDGIRRLYQAGAWFTADPVALGGCLVKEQI
jgi:hypothetical protein